MSSEPQRVASSPRQLPKDSADNRPSKRRMPDPSKERPPRKSTKKQKTASGRSEGSHDEVLAYDISALLSTLDLTALPSTASEAKPKLPLLDTEISLTITHLSSTGSGIGIYQDRPYVVPFVYPGDTLTTRITRHTSATATTPAHSTAFPVTITTPNSQRNDDLVKCKYFGTCSGCQFQPLPYSAQLSHKRTIIERAYQNFSSLPLDVVPGVADTIGSPLEYGYRTKLTPHFDGPRQARNWRRKGEKVHWDQVPDIGFNRADGTRRVLDVEECPIGTESVQKGLRRERKRVVEHLDEYKRGATVLLRESSVRVPKGGNGKAEGEKKAGRDEDPSVVLEDQGPEKDYILKKSCTSDHRGTSTEYVGDVLFKNPANAFFQNNNSILPRFTEYIRQHVLPPSQQGSVTTEATSNDSTDATAQEARPRITNLIDAYSGSGLFSLTLSSLFTNTLGIDISAESIASANENLHLNGLDNSSSRKDTRAASPNSQPKRNIAFSAGDAKSLFASADRSIFKGENTAVIIDPPRKGCDEGFLTQLLEFAPERVVYVSCNVHTQARDVGWILRGGNEVTGEVSDRHGAEGGEAKGKQETGKEVQGQYILESLQGFDFFPQTAHVESVAVLQRRH